MIELTPEMIKRLEALTLLEMDEFPETPEQAGAVLAGEMPLRAKQLYSLQTMIWAKVEFLENAKEASDLAVDRQNLEKTIFEFQHEANMVKCFLMIELGNAFPGLYTPEISWMVCRDWQVYLIFPEDSANAIPEEVSGLASPGHTCH